MAKIGIVTFSDGRRYAHEPQVAENRAFQERLARALARAGHEVVPAEEIVWTNALARQEGERLARAGVEATIFNYAVWAFPQFTVMASRFAPGPYLLFGQVNPSKPGMVAVLAAAGVLDQIGVSSTRVFGEIEDREVASRVGAWATAAHAARRLRGETYGLFGGRAIGINTAVANTTSGPGSSASTWSTSTSGRSSAGWERWTARGCGGRGSGWSGTSGRCTTTTGS